MPLKPARLFRAVTVPPFGIAGCRTAAARSFGILLQHLDDLSAAACPSSARCRRASGSRACCPRRPGRRRRRRPGRSPPARPSGRARRWACRCGKPAWRTQVAEAMITWPVLRRGRSPTTWQRRAQRAPSNDRHGKGTALHGAAVYQRAFGAKLNVAAGRVVPTESASRSWSASKK